MQKSSSSGITIILLIIIAGLGYVIYDYDMLGSDREDEEQVEESETSSNWFTETVESVTGESEPEVKEESVVTPPKVVAPKPVEITPTPVVVTPAASDVEPIDIGSVIVTYTDSGFTPMVVEVTQGNSITFVNISSKPLWIHSRADTEDGLLVYRGLDQGKSMFTGGSYVFSFTKVGEYGYINLNNEKHQGRISVVPQ